MTQAPPDCDALCALFDELFLASENTRLVKGGDEPVYLAPPVIAELEYGVHRARTAAQRNRRASALARPGAVRPPCARPSCRSSRRRSRPGE